MTVRTYRSTDAGAASLTISNVAGNLISVLDAVLVNGYSVGTVSSITRTGATATVTFSAAHGLATYGNMITIAGAEQTEYNGEHEMTWVSITEMSFTVSGTPATPATGTITATKAGAGWTKPYSGANLAAYRQGGGNNHYLYIDDSGTTYARAVGYETMSSIGDTTGNAFPTSAQLAGGLYFLKSNAATARAWVVVATPTDFYYWIDYTGSPANALLNFFGDIDSDVNADSYKTAILGNYASSSTSTAASTLGTNNISTLSGHYIDRDYTQTGTSQQIGKTSAYSTAIGKTGSSYPSPVTGKLNYAVIYISAISSDEKRGDLPGALNPLHNKPLTHLDTLIINSKVYLVLDFYNLSQIFIEISNTR